MQIESLLQQRERGRHQFLRFFAELRVEVRMIESVHPALESSCVLGSIKELSRDAQCTDLVTSGPSGTNLISFAKPSHRRGALEMCEAADDLASLDEKLDGLVRNIPPVTVVIGSESPSMSAFGGKADIGRTFLNVCF